MATVEKRPRALIVGATSDMARALSYRLAKEGYALQLAARNPEALEREAQDLEVRTGIRPSLYHCDVAESDFGVSFVDKLEPLPHVAICAIGDLGCQEKAQGDKSLAARLMGANYTGPALVMEALALCFEQRGSGVLVGISSVAGDRGRGSNYIYGSAKAAFSAYLSGLRNRLAPRGVHVMTIKPGFVRTRMTEGLDLPPLLTASPEQVARGILRGLKKRRDVIYILPLWRLIMGLIGLIPEGLFKRMRL